MVCGLIAGCASSETGRYEKMIVAESLVLREKSDAPKRLQNATLAEGTFILGRRCVQVLVDNATFTPVFTQGISIGTKNGSLAVGPTSIQPGKPYSLPFAVELEKSREIAANLALPPDCSPRILSMGVPTPLKR